MALTRGPVQASWRCGVACCDGACRDRPRGSPTTRGLPGGPDLPDQAPPGFFLTELVGLLVGERVLDDPQRRPGIAYAQRIPGFDQGPQHYLTARVGPPSVLLQSEALLAELTPKLLKLS